MAASTAMAAATPAPGTMRFQRSVRRVPPGPRRLLSNRSRTAGDRGLGAASPDTSSRVLSNRARSTGVKGRGRSDPASSSSGPPRSRSSGTLSPQLPAQPVAPSLKQGLDLDTAALDYGGDVLHGHVLQVLHDQDLAL